MKEEKAQNIGPERIEMVYQRFDSPASPPVFLIMGGGAQMIAWPDGFCTELVNHGLQPYRFDNRDMGNSTHFTNAPIPDLNAAQAGDFSSVFYTLSDLSTPTQPGRNDTFERT